MNQKDNRRVRMTKQILSDSLLELLQSEDIHKISIRTLCEKADVNRSTFYKYYGSQYDLLKEMENHLLEQIEEVLTGSSPISDNHKNMTKLLCFAEEHSELFRLLLNANIDPDFPKRLLTLPAIFQKFQEMFPDDTSQELIYRQDFLFYGGYQVIKRWINTKERESPEKMAAILENIFLSSASSDSSHQILSDPV